MKKGTKIQKQEKKPVQANFGRFKAVYSPSKRCLKCDAKVSTTYNGKCEDCAEYFD